MPSDKGERRKDATQLKDTGLEVPPWDSPMKPPSIRMDFQSNTRRMVTQR